MDKTTEKESHYHDLEHQSTSDILQWMNREDHTVADAVQVCLPSIENLVNAFLSKMKEGARLFYMGSGTSGRLGVVDASELPPTFGVDFDKVIGIIAGGDSAIRRAVEGAEDDTNQGWLDLQMYNIQKNDLVIGIAASGTTPYVISALKACQDAGIITGCITCNPKSPIIEVSNYPIVAEVGPEFITGSTRLKAGTAQKMILNMISTTLMIKLGHVQGNRMVDMQLSNAKLIDRGTLMIMNAIQSDDYKHCQSLLIEYGSVRKAIESQKKT